MPTTRTARCVRRTALGCVVVALVAGCGGATPSAPAPTSAPAAVPSVLSTPRLPPDGRFDDQIGGPYAPAPDVAVVDRDRHEEPVPGRFNVCYVNAFQTQPEDARSWTRKHPDLLARRHGKRVSDPGWPGEYLLDTSTEAKRRKLLAIVGPWVDGCAASGFQAVELDNLDSWTRSKKALTRAGNLAFAAGLVRRAHAKGMAVAQKNTAELGATGRTRVGFDFAIAEECQVYDECDAYTTVYGDQVVEVEYTDNPRSAFTRACRARGTTISVLLRDRDVVAEGEPGYAYEEC